VQSCANDCGLSLHPSWRVSTDETLRQATKSHLRRKQQHYYRYGMQNGRNLLWDDNLLVSQYGASRRMGDMLNEILDSNHLQILNDGRPTYITESSRSALDITAYKCNQLTKWKVVDDDIRLDHQVIITDIGVIRSAQRKTVKDWK